MIVLKVTDNVVKVLWTDNNKIESMCIDTFITKYGIEKLPKFL
jgi:hypothetical protein